MTALKKITTAAKKIRKAAPRKTWKAAVKEASVLYRKGRLGAVKYVERGESKATKPARVYQVTRTKAGRFKPGGVKRIAGIAPAVVSKSSIAAHYKVSLAKQLLARELATTKTEKKKQSALIATTRRALKYLGGK